MISSLDNINSLNSVKRGASSISYGTFYIFFFRQNYLKVSEKVVKGWALSSGSAYLPKFGQFSNNCNLDKVVLLCKRTFSSNFPPFFSLFFLQEDFPITNVFFLFLMFFFFSTSPSPSSILPVKEKLSHISGNKAFTMLQDLLLPLALHLGNKVIIRGNVINWWKTWIW